jgi:hypothetical protein
MVGRILRAPVTASWVLAGILLAVVSAWALQYTRAWTPVRSLTAAVYRPADATPLWTGEDISLNPARLAVLAKLSPEEPFEVEWRGLLVVQETGIHRLRARVDDGLGVWVDDRPVIEALDGLGQLQPTAPVELMPGLYPIRLRYVQRGGEGLLRFSWQRPSSREEFHVVPVIASTDPPPVFRRIDKALRYPRQVAIAWSLWLIVGLAIAGAAMLESAAGAPVLNTLGTGRLLLLLAVAVPLLGSALDLGVLPWRGWAPDEIRPRDVIIAVDHAFSGGWHHLYPPLMFYVLAIVHAPFELLNGLGWLRLGDAVVYGTLHTLDRVTMLTLGVLTCIGVWLLAHRTIGARASRWAPYALVGVPLFAFYCKTTNVDVAYTFWVVVAALAFLRAIQTRGVAAHILLGAAAAAAVASKDQAYGYFPGAALALLWFAWRASAGRPAGARLLATLADRPLWAGLAAFLATYSVLLAVWWNLEGVQQHIHLITGPASVPFRMFPNTMAGLAALTSTTGLLLFDALGPLVALAAAVGAALSLRAASAPDARWLLVLPLGYLVTFVALVGYVYDRFLLAVAPFAVLFAARGLGWAMERIRPAPLRRMAAGLVLTALLYPTYALDRRLATDSRFEAEAWMQQHLTDDPLVLAVGSRLYLPNLYTFQHRVLSKAAPDELLGWQPDVIVFNEDWFTRRDQPSYATVERELARAGYVEAFTTGPASPPPGVLGWLASGLTVAPRYSNLSKTSPPISIWRKVGAAATSETPAAHR